MFWILFRPERIAYCEGPIVLRGSRKIRVSDGEHMLLPDSMRPEPMFTYSALYNTTHFSLLVAIGRRGVFGEYSPCRSDLCVNFRRRDSSAQMNNYPCATLILSRFRSFMCRLPTHGFYFTSRRFDLRVKVC